MSDIIKRDDCLKVIDRFIGYLDEDMIYRIKLKLKQDVPTVEERPTGKWIIDVCEAGKVWDSHCSKCNKDLLRFVAGTEDWWVYKEDLPNYCPNCGAAMKGEE